MKKFLSLAILSTVSFSAFAATSGQLNLRGTVAPLLEISVSPESIAQNLDLTSNQSNLKVASVNEKSNSRTGYKVNVSSANGGLLVHQDGVGVDSFAYALSYGGNGVNLASGSNFTSAVGARNVNKDVNISYTGRAQSAMVAGQYSDVVTFTISAN